MPSYKCKATTPKITPYPPFLLSVLLNGTTTQSDAFVSPTRAAPIPLPAQAKFQADAGGSAGLASAATSGYIPTGSYNACFGVFLGKTF
jgi:hypothetical protein